MKIRIREEPKILRMSHNLNCANQWKRIMWRCALKI